MYREWAQGDLGAGESDWHQLKPIPRGDRCAQRKRKKRNAPKARFV